MRLISWRLGAVASALTLSACASTPTPPSPDGEFWLQRDGARVARLVPLGPPDPQLAAKGATPPATFVHPLLSGKGAILTELYPADHIHQRGLFWGWHQIIIDGTRRANGWLLMDIRFNPVASSVAERGKAGTMTTDWIVGDRAVLREEARIHVTDTGLAVRVTLTPLVDGFALGGSADDKGYGGISLRLRDADQMRFESLGKPVEAKRQAIEAGETVRFSWDGAPASLPRSVSMRCTVDGKPITSWILRREASMQNCVWPGATPVALARGRPVVLTAEISIED